MEGAAGSLTRVGSGTSEGGINRDSEYWQLLWGIFLSREQSWKAGFPVVVNNGMLCDVNSLVGWEHWMI